MIFSASHLLDVQEAEMLLPEEHVGVVTGRKISADIKLFRIDLLAEK